MMWRNPRLSTTMANPREPRRTDHSGSAMVDARQHSLWQQTRQVQGLEIPSSTDKIVVTEHHGTVFDFVHAIDIVADLDKLPTNVI